jgi:hypothetical protein
MGRLMSNDQEAGLPELGFEAYARWRASEVGKITEQLERRLIIELVGDVDGRKIWAAAVEIRA